MTDTSMLPQPGETIMLPNGEVMSVAWCSGWVWPLGEKAPTRLYAQPIADGEVQAIELSVTAARDVAGERFWLAERRTL